ncbi:hypothetical protein C8R48DRAFT_782298 [Suillus tomentosus]|nr:hypothetical protein C8R48DRAFT_782298 [Suillus tomentosus]
MLHIRKFLRQPTNGPAPTGTTVLYPASFDLSTSQAASSYGYHNTLSAAGGQHQPGGSDIGPAHDTSAYSNYPPPYSQNLVGGSHNSLALSQLPSSAVSAFQQACSQYLQDGSSNLNVAQSAPQGPAFPSTSLYNPNTSQAASAHGYCDSQHAADSQHQPESSNSEPAHHAAAHSNYRHPYLQGPVGGDYNNPVQSELPSTKSNPFPSDLVFMNTNDVIPSHKADVLTSVSNDDYFDVIVQGLFKSTLLLQVFKAIFTSPSFAREVTGDGYAANVIEAYRCAYNDFPSGKKVRTRGVCRQAQFMTPWVNPYPITPYWNTYYSYLRLWVEIEVMPLFDIRDNLLNISLILFVVLQNREAQNALDEAKVEVMPLAGKSAPTPAPTTTPAKPGTSLNRAALTGLGLKGLPLESGAVES